MTRLLAKASIVTMMFGTLFAAGPVHAAEATGVSDTLDRLKISETATHTLVATFPTGTWDNGETVIFDYNAAGFALTDSAPACTLGTGDCDAVVASATNSVTLYCNDAGGCGGLLTLATFSGDNPGTAGSKSVSITGDGGITGSLAIGIADDDQVTVTATVAVTMTFDLDVGTSTGSASAAPYVVALGTLTTGAVSTSGAGGINMIGVDVDTNASGGAVVQVKAATANGLVSASVPTDTIDLDTDTLVAGTEGYGICVHAVSATTGAIHQATSGTFGTGQLTSGTSTTCDATNHQLGTTGLSDSFQNILDSNDLAVSIGRAEIFVKAAISTTTAAHDDYSDTLTFRATATF